MNRVPDGLEGVSLPPLGEYEPLQLCTPQLLEAYWPIIRPHLDRCVRKSLRGEYEVDDLKFLAQHGHITIIAFANDLTGLHPDRDCCLVLAIEPVSYPRLNGINILAMGGRDLGLMERKFWKHIKYWAYMNGARTIEASVSPAMQRVLARLGFLPVYMQVRCDLTEV